MDEVAFCASGTLQNAMMEVVIRIVLTLSWLCKIVLLLSTYGMFLRVASERSQSEPFLYRDVSACNPRNHFDFIVLHHTHTYIFNSSYKIAMARGKRGAATRGARFSKRLDMMEGKVDYGESSLLLRSKAVASTSPKTTSDLVQLPGNNVSSVPAAPNTEQSRPQAKLKPKHDPETAREEELGSSDALVSNRASCGILTLPQELRDMIYGYVLSLEFTNGELPPDKLEKATLIPLNPDDKQTIKRWNATIDERNDLLKLSKSKLKLERAYCRKTLRDRILSSDTSFRLTYPEEWQRDLLHLAYRWVFADHWVAKWYQRLARYQLRDLASSPQAAVYPAAALAVQKLEQTSSTLPVPCSEVGLLRANKQIHAELQESMGERMTVKLACNPYHTFSAREINALRTFRRIHIHFHIDQLAHLNRAFDHLKLGSWSRQLQQALEPREDIRVVHFEIHAPPYHRWNELSVSMTERGEGHGMMLQRSGEDIMQAIKGAPKIKTREYQISVHHDPNLEQKYVDEGRRIVSDIVRSSSIGHEQNETTTASSLPGKVTRLPVEIARLLDQIELCDRNCVQGAVGRIRW
jgi:hypothetical protein